MTEELRPLYGDLVIPFNSETQSYNGGDESNLKVPIRKMVEEAAYYLSEKRAFAPGYELEDWFTAEVQILKHFLNR